MKKRKSAVTNKNPGGQVPKPATDHQQVRKRQLKSKPSKITPAMLSKNYST